MPERPTRQRPLDWFPDDSVFDLVPSSGQGLSRTPRTLKRKFALRNHSDTLDWLYMPLFGNGLSNLDVSRSFFTFTNRARPPRPRATRSTSHLHRVNMRSAPETRRKVSLPRSLMSKRTRIRYVSSLGSHRLDGSTS
jgi:hypothetical protein